jgi:adenine-specific DNA-methyltransferase
MRPNTFFEKYPNSSASKLLIKLGIPFPFSKPYELISWLQKISGITGNDIVLDFFAGSAATAHAVLDLNKQDNCSRKFILVQLPEPYTEDTESLGAGYKTIADIGKERIRRAIKMLKEEPEENKDLESVSACDRGFRVFKLDKSNFKQWLDYKGKDPKELTSLFKEHETPLVDSWKPENLLIEVMLQEGFPLDSETAELKEYKKNVVIQVTSEFCEHKLLVCFDKKIYPETIGALDIQGEDIFVCLDSALSDEQKITLSDKGFLKTI